MCLLNPFNTKLKPNMFRRPLLTDSDASVCLSNMSRQLILTQKDRNYVNVVFHSRCGTVYGTGARVRTVSGCSSRLICEGSSDKPDERRKKNAGMAERITRNRTSILVVSVCHSCRFVRL